MALIVRNSPPQMQNAQRPGFDPTGPERSSADEAAAAHSRYFFIDPWTKRSQVGYSPSGGTETDTARRLSMRVCVRAFRKRMKT